MKRLMMLLLVVCLTMPALAEALEITPSMPPLMCNTPAPEVSGAPECWIVAHGCLTDFLRAWSEDMNGEAMLALCAPSWKAQQADPELALFLLLRNREATAWSIGEPTDGDDRLYEVAVLLDDYSGRGPQWYRFTFRLVMEGGMRYVDPEGLATGEKTEEPEWYVTAEEAAAAQNSSEDDPGSWWHEAGAWNHAGDPDLWTEHNARFAGFMAAWMSRDVDRVLTYLTPGWMPEGDNPEWELQRRFCIYVPQSYTIQGVNVNDDTRRVTYSVRMIDAPPGFDSLMAVEFSVEVYWDADVWYIDPTGLPEAVTR